MSESSRIVALRSWLGPESREHGCCYRRAPEKQGSPAARLLVPAPTTVLPGPLPQLPHLGPLLTQPREERFLGAPAQLGQHPCLGPLSAEGSQSLGGLSVFCALGGAKVRLLPTVSETSLSEVTGQASLTRVTRLLRGSRVSASGESAVRRRWVGASRPRQSPRGRPARAGPEGPASRPGVVSAGLRWAWRPGQGPVGVRVAPGSTGRAGVRPRGQEGRAGQSRQGSEPPGLRGPRPRRDGRQRPTGALWEERVESQEGEPGRKRAHFSQGFFPVVLSEEGALSLEGRLAMSGDRLGVTPGTCPR